MNRVIDPLFVNIVGGLGNQLFQYAIGRALAKKLGRPVQYCIDQISQYSSNRSFRLTEIFAITASVALRTDLRNAVGALYALPKARRALAQDAYSWARPSRMVFENSTQFDASIFDRCRSAKYLHGNWQSERYFAEVAEVLRGELQFKMSKQVNDPALARIRSEPHSVAVHYRLGDYITNPKAARILGVQPVDYYKRAIARLRAALPDARFFLFSDEPGRARALLETEANVLESLPTHPGRTDHEELWLMTQCKHAIIANSSFSWWGAWLNSNAGKRVIAPNAWFANGEDSVDIVPIEWMRM